MKTFPLINRNTGSHGWADIAVMTLLTALSVYNGQATVFYIVYLFWWNEFLSMIIDWGFRKWGNKKLPASGGNNGTGFLLGIYWVFIIVIFGFIANWRHDEAMMINFEVMFFKNYFFNLNLTYFILMACFRNMQDEEVKQQPVAGITANMIVLHISIILGAFALFFIVRKYPATFTPENKWGSVLVITPFLLLRLLVQVMRQREADKRQ